VKTDEILGLIGPNGSGKSTLLACVSGTHETTTGDVRLNDLHITSQPPHKIAQLGVARTFQSVRMFTELTVLENVVAAIAARADHSHDQNPEAEALALLEELLIADLAKSNSGELAYGQSRRAEIARALALNPSFLLVDEPAAGMNEAETENLLQVLRKLCTERGLGLIIVDHDMHLIMRLCSRLIVLNKGQLIADGPPEEVRANPLVREAYLGSAREKQSHKQAERSST
jgi:branched-chain amino acid transport system permease protein